MTLKDHEKFGKKLNRCFQMSQIILANFFPTGKKGQILKFHWFVLSKRQVA